MPPRCSACCWSAPSVEPLPQSFHNANLIPRLGPSDCAFGSFGPDQGRFTSATILYMALSPTAMHQTVVERATPPRLSPERCRTLLREAKNGYLALSRSALPIVLPVSCALDGESLFLRAGPGSLDRITGQPGIVAFGTTMTSADGTCRSGDPGAGKSGERAGAGDRRASTVAPHKQQPDHRHPRDLGTLDRVAVRARFLDQQRSYQCQPLLLVRAFRHGTSS